MSAQEQSAPARPQKTIYLYAIQKAGEIKIGYSVNPTRRLLELSLAKYKPRVLIQKQTPTPRQDERVVHYLFHDRLVPRLLGGEWFDD